VERDGIPHRDKEDKLPHRSKTSLRQVEMTWWPKFHTGGALEGT